MRDKFKERLREVKSAERLCQLHNSGQHPNPSHTRKTTSHFRCEGYEVSFKTGSRRK